MGTADFFLTVSTAQVRMHHATLNGARANQSDLHHQVIEFSWAETRQHGHLSATLDLKYPDGVGLTDHVVGGLVLGGDAGDHLQGIEVLPWARPAGSGLTAHCTLLLRDARRTLTEEALGTETSPLMDQ